MTIAPGSRLGPYEIVSSVGAGRMGEVYKAREPGKRVEGANWVGRTEAEAEVVPSQKRFQANPHAIDHVGDPDHKH